MKKQRKENFSIRWLARVVLIVLVMVVVICAFGFKKTSTVAHVDAFGWHWSEKNAEDHLKNVSGPYITFAYDPDTKTAYTTSNAKTEQRDFIVAVRINEFQNSTYRFIYPEDIERFYTYLNSLRAEPATTIYVRRSLGLIDPDTTPAEMEAMLEEFKNMPREKQNLIICETVTALLKEPDGDKIVSEKPIF
ncbi:hypothetical protein IK146_00370 [Candidatus Saccharibacteria bacterium]|nr:hypothetical protein [Candidatus Saccharibacteria bacterium]